jgi:hypothetical protein
MAHSNLIAFAFSIALLLAVSASATEYGAPSNQFRAYGDPHATGAAPWEQSGNSAFATRDNRRPPYLGMNGWGWDSEDCNKGCAHSNR